VERAQLSRAKQPRNIDGKEDNMLWITNDGRKAALDMRMIFPDSKETPDNKVNSASIQVHEVWNRTKKEKGTQLVFLDLSTPGKETDNTERFDAYNALKNKLLRKGIPPQEIAFIHDYPKDDQKAILFDKMNSGEIRILIGSSQKMGAGMNVQKKLKALHHVDVPWRPSDIEQREG
ncbi:TPA: helicase, partial [Listeria monocytogenes]|nr:helicase [Listeria monocytogenes]